MFDLIFKQGAGPHLHGPEFGAEPDAATAVAAAGRRCFSRAHLGPNLVVSPGLGLAPSLGPTSDLVRRRRRRWRWRLPAHGLPVGRLEVFKVVAASAVVELFYAPLEEHQRVPREEVRYVLRQQTVHAAHVCAGASTGAIRRGITGAARSGAQRGVGDRIHGPRQIVKA